MCAYLPAGERTCPTRSLTKGTYCGQSGIVEDDVLADNMWLKFTPVSEMHCLFGVIRHAKSLLTHEAQAVAGMSGVAAITMGYGDHTESADSKRRYDIALETVTLFD
ncbi:hypothetical protein A0H81_09403 [Grifola frondosa]|uniref:Uncharacterized protein n=1 Tax=Grifola frondosa TaxID=5627 RepID=A0A1C7M3D8_GRIFR|nr:hypothetical protein A0H81_09403 [Grifola frondosa]